MHPREDSTRESTNEENRQRKRERKRERESRRTLKGVEVLENRFTGYISITVGGQLDPLANIYFLQRHFSFAFVKREALSARWVRLDTRRNT